MRPDRPRYLKDKCGDYRVTVTLKRKTRAAVPMVSKYSDNAVGLDYKADGLFVTSDGVSADYVKPFKNLEVKLARAQKKLSGMVRGSRRYEKQKRKVAKIYRKMADQRRDRLHKLSAEIADRYDIVCVESLSMTEIAGTDSKPRLGKFTYDNAYGMFIRMPEYKLEERGKYLVKVDKWYPSTQICSVCGRKHKIPLDSRTYQCECGNIMNRDINAAVNIKNEGLRILRG